MFSFNSYYRILNLQASNKNLLGIYHHVLEKDDLSDLKPAILHKIKLREEIHDQLRRCLEENYFPKQAWIVSEASRDFFLSLIQAKYEIQKIYRPVNWEFCVDCEVENIRNYYKILFDKRYSRKVTNLLLAQKAKIETSISEAKG